jgi:hypothetical protein
VSWRVLAAILLLGSSACESREPQPTAAENGNRPPLALLTGLPLAFGEGFDLQAPSHPVMQRLARDYSVTLIDGPEQIGSGALLLAAQPRALTAQRLLALDRWVRNGGRLLLLADPQLVWPTDLPLGDPQRPPVEFSDTGLLAHWGLRLEAPAGSGPAMRRVGQREIMTGSPGTLTAFGPACRVEAAGLVARCRIGRGRVVVVADADFLHVAGEGALDGPTDENLALLVSELAALSR